MKLPFPQILSSIKCPRKRGLPSTGPRSLNDVTPQLAADEAHESRGHKETSAPFCTGLSCLEQSQWRCSSCEVAEKSKTSGQRRERNVRLKFKRFMR